MTMIVDVRKKVEQEILLASSAFDSILNSCLTKGCRKDWGLKISCTRPETNQAEGPVEFERMKLSFMYVCSELRLGSNDNALPKPGSMLCIMHLQLQVQRVVDIST
jgi:hypothetical protein